MSIFIYKFFYNFFWLIAKPIFTFFFRLEVESQEDLKKIKGPLIIAANHLAWVDPFLIGINFPFLSKVFPIRYACWHKYFYSPRLFILVWIFGGFPVKRKIGIEESLKGAVKILENKGVVGIFPEGKRRRGGRPRRGRKGIAYLSLKTKTKILPIKIEAKMNMTAAKFFLRRYKVKVKIGKTFSLPFQEKNKSQNLNKAANLIMEKIRGL